MSAARLQHLIEHLEHVLLAQAPIKDFVHPNTLHGFQHLHFAEALRAARQLTGVTGYLPEARFREFVAAGRIRREDLESVPCERLCDEVDAVLVTLPGRVVSKGEPFLVRFLFPSPRPSRSQLRWQVEEMGARVGFQTDVPESLRAALVAESGSDGKTAGADRLLVRPTHSRARDVRAVDDEVVSRLLGMADQMRAAGILEQAGSGCDRPRWGDPGPRPGRDAHGLGRRAFSPLRGPPSAHARWGLSWRI